MGWGKTHMQAEKTLNKVLAAVIVLVVLGAVAGLFFASTASVTENVTTADTGNDDANLIMPALGILLAFTLGIAFVRLAQNAIRDKK